MNDQGLICDLTCLEGTFSYFFYQLRCIFTVHLKKFSNKVEDDRNGIPQTTYFKTPSATTKQVGT